MPLTFNIQRVTGTTDTNGDATATGDLALGKVYAIYANIDALDAGADTTITYTRPDGDAVNVLELTNDNTSNMFYPRESEDDNTGGGGSGVTTPMIDGVPKVVVAQGGSEKYFEIDFYIETV